MDYLQNGIPVRYFEKGEERSSIVYLVDYKNPDNNSFIVANQWTFIENSNKRPDILLFLNGIPVVIVELKSPSREETDASAAYRQLRNYMKEIPSMFIYNAICVMSDQMTSKSRYDYLPAKIVSWNGKRSMEATRIRSTHSLIPSLRECFKRNACLT